MFDILLRTIQISSVKRSAGVVAQVQGLGCNRSVKKVLGAKQEAEASERPGSSAPSDRTENPTIKAGSASISTEGHGYKHGGRFPTKTSKIIGLRVPVTTAVQPSNRSHPRTLAKANVQTGLEAAKEGFKRMVSIIFVPPVPPVDNTLKETENRDLTSPAEKEKLRKMRQGQGPRRISKYPPSPPKQPKKQVAKPTPPPAVEKEPIKTRPRIASHIPVNKGPRK